MHYILGLGNPGEKYADTRHNAGQIVLKIAGEESGWPQFFSSSKAGGEISEFSLGGKDVTVVFPSTFMNESGKVAKKLKELSPDADLTVVYDDIDLPFGEVRVSFGRGDGGHNGIKSVANSLGSKDFTRVRVGIAPKSLFGKQLRPQGEKLNRYVLGRLTGRELKKLEEVAKNLPEILTLIVEQGPEAAMNQFN